MLSSSGSDFRANQMSEESKDSEGQTHLGNGGAWKVKDGFRYDLVGRWVLLESVSG